MDLIFGYFSDKNGIHKVKLPRYNLKPLNTVIT